MTGPIMTLYPIGRARTPYANLSDCPGSSWDSDRVARIDIDEPYHRALHGLAPEMLIFVLWWLDESHRDVLALPIAEGGAPLGIFASRAPHRPNPIGLTVARVVAVGERTVDVRGLECRDGSVIVDLKPAVRAADGLLI
jgi:tRNA-Thr(GGU) m(6)t(6)A37 methyltransferase TsaA